MQLNTIKDNRGATANRKRLGRGIGSGLGKTSGRGHKGQKSRSGVAIKGFEGGQMPIHRRLPKHGFKNPFRIEYEPVNIGRLQGLVDQGRLDVSASIDTKTLVEAGVVKRVKHGIKLLGVGELKAKLDLSVHAASKSAIKAIEAAGGKVTLLAKPKKAAETPAE